MILSKRKAKALVEQAVNANLTYNEIIRLIMDLYESFLNADFDVVLLTHQLELAEGHIINSKKYS
jgi:hypothetical protein